MNKTDQFFSTVIHTWIRYYGIGISRSIYNQWSNSNCMEPDGEQSWETTDQAATKADTPVEALKANKLTILCLTEYDIMYKVLNDVTDALQDRVLVNLSSDTSEKARKAEQWAHTHGAEFLSGGVMDDPPLGGTGTAAIVAWFVKR